MCSGWPGTVLGGQGSWRHLQRGLRQSKSVVEVWGLEKLACPASLGEGEGAAIQGGHSLPLAVTERRRERENQFRRDRQDVEGGKRTRHTNRSAEQAIDCPPPPPILCCQGEKAHSPSLGNWGSRDPRAHPNYLSHSHPPSPCLPPPGHSDTTSSPPPSRALWRLGPG